MLRLGADCCANPRLQTHFAEALLGARRMSTGGRGSCNVRSEGLRIFAPKFGRFGPHVGDLARVGQGMPELSNSGRISWGKFSTIVGTLFGNFWTGGGARGVCRATCQYLLGNLIFFVITGFSGDDNIGNTLVLRWHGAGIAVVLHWHCTGSALVLDWECVGAAVVLYGWLAQHE